MLGRGVLIICEQSRCLKLFACSVLWGGFARETSKRRESDRGRRPRLQNSGGGVKQQRRDAAATLERRRRKRRPYPAAGDGDYRRGPPAPVPERRRRQAAALPRGRGGWGIRKRRLCLSFFISPRFHW